MHQIRTFDVSDRHPTDMGFLLFKELPRIGEWVEVLHNGSKCFAVVAMVAHSSAGEGCEIFLRHSPGNTRTIENLCT